ncbi:hypothetical protein LOTGIDRAFT_169792 [Lottia gigantea]|uniref:Uncharacterized protein n=1 Tax=Lottia gigantea TaxID=225164 RepID=V3ZKM6_LOTGI|nr:hypothetical protein LOTGIDRAFT_169792 [Lottia gigantea]ESO82965.1 hypothetical protein LOTGIDRAFT_169792 [Lottia gigantea]
MFLRVLCLTTLLAGVALAVGPCAPNEDFLAILGAIHKTPSYGKLTAEEKVMLTEIFAEAASCQLTVYVNTIGFSKVIGLIDHLSAGEAHFLNHYLQQHLNWEKSLSSILTKAPTKPPRTTNNPTSTTM